jgi:phosphoserine phosphatase RsbU/P
MPKQTTIFRQLIFNVVVPAFLALILLGIINYTHTRNILVGGIETQNQIITDEILNVLEFQDVALGLVEKELDTRMAKLSDRLVNFYFKNTDIALKANLTNIRKELGMDPSKEDIYIINTNGVIINTTFANDQNRNLFDYGEEHRQYLLKVFADRKFVSERIAIEGSTKRLKKYTYHPTTDGRYIIELGAYSGQGDEIIEFIRNRMNTLARKKQGIISVDLFLGADKSFSLNPDARIIPAHIPILKSVFKKKENKTIIDHAGGGFTQYDYIYIDRQNTNLYKSGVVRIITDRSIERDILMRELIKFLAIFIVTVVAVIILIYRKTRVITDPIKKLVHNVIRITDGHLKERADVIGNNEISTLSQKFNIMIEQLESYYYELEEKVKERTAQIQHQKEEIEAQRDAIESQNVILAEINENLQSAYVEIEAQKKHITDSIVYAKRIQNAILPPDEHVRKLIPESFILYLPKDIVSGDFYWLAGTNDKIIVAAVDCTGHGVPGAFMSIVGNNQLNYAVNVLGHTKPADILNALNHGVTTTLRQSRSEKSIRDGMDVALCTIDTAERKLEFAGAFNSAFVFRNGELIMLPADKFPIGAFIDDALPPFTHHQLDLQAGDVIYIFSDGYVDQFGGTDNKKYLIKRFRTLLTEVSGLPMEDQKKKLQDVHDTWKGKNELVDDILVIGIRIT